MRQTVWTGSLGLINSSWTATTGVTGGVSSPSSLPPTIAIGVVMFAVDRIIGIMEGKSRCGNEASMMELDEKMLPVFLRFDPAPRPVQSVDTARPTPDYFL